ncbi:MAG: hypothetical protein WBF17_27645 [Phycisphaerae bacterium]
MPTATATGGAERRSGAPGPARGALDSWGLAVLNLLIFWTVLLLVLVWVLHRLFPR